MTGRIVASFVVRNEMDRYWPHTLRLSRRWADTTFVWDDQSYDHTLEEASNYADVALTRPSHYPSFLENESHFRRSAWEAMADELDLTSDDWVFAIDADEALVSLADTRVSDSLRYSVSMAASEEADAVEFQVYEVWERDPIRVRNDGAWGQITGTRLVRYNPDAQFADKVFACGQTPVPDKVVRSSGLGLLHFGYVTEEDRVTKHARYSKLPGHNQRHIDSILTKPRLREWTSGNDPLAEIAQ